MARSRSATLRWTWPMRAPATMGGGAVLAIRASGSSSHAPATLTGVLTSRAGSNTFAIIFNRHDKGGGDEWLSVRATRIPVRAVLVGWPDGSCRGDVRGVGAGARRGSEADRRFPRLLAERRRARRVAGGALALRRRRRRRS